MSQTLLFLVLHCVGVSVALAIGPRSKVALCCALGFPIGLAVMVSVALFMLSAHIPYTVLTGTLASAVVIAGGIALLQRRGGLSPHAWKRVGLWTAAFVAVCLPLTAVNLSILTFDSHMMVMLGQALIEDHGFAPGVLIKISDWGVFQFVAHSGVGFVKARYLYSLAPVLGLSAMVAFAVALWHAVGVTSTGSGRQRVALVALMTALPFSLHMIVHHSFYIHSNLGTAVFMFLFAGLFWIGENDDADALPVAFVALFAVALHRIENPVICALLLSMTALQSRAPRRTLVTCLVVYSAAVIAWYVYLANITEPSSEFLTPTKCYAVAALTAVFCAYAVATALWRPRWIEALHRAAPALLLAGVLLGIAAAFALKTEHMTQSLDALHNNFWAAAYYEYFWLGAVALGVIGLFVSSAPFKQVFVYGIPMYLGMMVLLAYGRSPYRYGQDDSATRMGIHVVPMIFFYLGVKFAPFLLEPRRHRS